MPTRKCSAGLLAGLLVLALVDISVCFQIIPENMYRIFPDSVTCGGFGLKPIDYDTTLEDLEIPALFPGSKFLSLDRDDGLNWLKILIELDNFMISPNTTFVKPGNVLRICRKSGCVNVYPNETALHYIKNEDEDEWDDLFLSNVLYATCYKWNPPTDEPPCSEVKLPQDECFRVYRDVECSEKNAPFVPIFRNSLAFHPDYVSEEFYSYVFNPTCNLELTAQMDTDSIEFNTWNYTFSQISEAQNRMSRYDGRVGSNSVVVNHAEFSTIFQDILAKTSNSSTALIRCECGDTAKPLIMIEIKDSTLMTALLSVFIPLSVIAVSAYIIYSRYCPKAELIEFSATGDLKPWPDVPEISRRHISFNVKNVIGEGEYGVVYKGHLKTKTFNCKVAVKTIKKPYTAHTVKSFMNEIKLTHFIGTHSNVICFIGACTKKLNTGQVFSIVQLCENGSMDNYMRKMHDGLNLSAKCVVVIDPTGQEGCYVQAKPIQGSNHSNLDETVSRRLVKWAKEIASGMAYLGQKNVVHIDLAARNVFLDDLLVAKVGDFGLSRKLYTYSRYTKHGDDYVPWKWMSVESLSRNVFTVKNDVWSYGVTLWEMFNLGMSEPYPHIKTLDQLIAALTSGERLPCATYATQNISRTTRKCWNLDPSRRPEFSWFENYFEDILNRLSAPTAN